MSGAPLASQVVTTALKALCWETPAHAAPIAEAAASALGALLEATVLSKTTGLLAAHTSTQTEPTPCATVARFLASILRAHHYKTTIYRAHALTVTHALTAADIPVAVLNGLAVETALYAGTGARQISDIDLLLHPHHLAAATHVLSDLGFRPARSDGPWMRPTRDPLVPHVRVDLATRTAHTRDPHRVRLLLERREQQSLPGSGGRLPVLTATDALTHTLARLSTPARPRTSTPWRLYADAIRLHRAATTAPTPAGPTTAAALRGWAELRQVWKDLPSHPFTAAPVTERP